MMQEKGLSNYELHYFAQDQDKQKGHGSDYVSITNKYEDESLDFVLIDGIYRGACSNAALRLLRPGGILVLDDAHWYLPSDSRSQSARSRIDGPASPDWEVFQEATKDWRCFWTSDNCLRDTAIFIKACR
jgi:hypothetical protein